MIRYYTQADDDAGRARRKKALLTTALASLPFFVLAAAAFVLRMEPLCIAGCILCGGAAILLWDLRVKPALRYCRFLAEIRRGASHDTLGTLVRVSEDLCYDEGVNFREVIVNVYEDQSEEGERRFLLEESKEMPAQWLGSDVVLTSHGSYILAARLHGAQEAGA